MLVALHYQQVQWFRFRDTQCCQNRVSLTTMVRLMIEQMSENFPTRLPLGGSVQSAVIPLCLEGGFVQGLNECDNSAVLFDSSSVQ